jgi:hypothetical protein
MARRKRNFINKNQEPQAQLTEEQLNEIALHQQRLKKLDDAIVKTFNESMDLFDNFVDPLEDFQGLDEPGIPLGSAGSNRPGAERAGFGTETELTRARQFCRLLAESNEFAISAIDNRISYGVGIGHTYHVSPKKNAEVDPAVIDQTQAYLDEWTYNNDWGHRQAEHLRRFDRDGEVIIRKFKHKDELKIRCVEPWQLSQPAGKENASFGIETDEDDVETVVNYWIDGEAIDPQDIQHRKANVDCNVKRGVPILWAVKDNLRRASKIYKNMALMTDIHTAIALIRKHSNATADSVSSFRANKTNYYGTNPITGKSRHKQQYQPGTILDAPAGVEYDFPAGGLDPSKYTHLVDCLLRAVAARMNMPEFMLSANASNANYSSTMIAEGPAVKAFERLQATMARDDVKIIYDVIDYAVELGKLPKEAGEQVEIQVGRPSLISRDVTTETNRDKILYEAKILSPQSFAARNGLDYEQEQQNIKDLAQPDTTVAPMPILDPTKAAVNSAVESVNANFKTLLNQLCEELKTEHHEH